MALNSLELEITANTSKAVKSLDQLTTKLDEVNRLLNGLNYSNLSKLSTSLQGLKDIKISQASTSATNGVTKVNNALVSLAGNTKKADRGFQGLQATMFRLASTFGMFYASAYPFIKLFNGIWSATQTSMDYVETYNYYKVSMAKIGAEAGKEYADKFEKELAELNKKMSGFDFGSNGELLETSGKMLGADAEKLLNFQAKIGAVTNSMGLMGKTSVATQKALSMLSQDLSSLTNTDLDTVMTNLSSGLIGMSRSLYKYGIDITNINLKQYALANNITKSVSAMTQGEKAQLRMLAILDQSKVAWGDMANTVNSSANQYRIFRQEVANLGRVFGNLFLPIVQKVLPYLNAMMIVLRKLFTMLGFKSYGDSWLSDLAEGTSSVNFDDISDGIDDSADAMDNASKSAKKLKAQLMGIDELNILSDQDTGSGNSKGGGASFDLSGAINNALADYESFWNEAFNSSNNKVAELVDSIMESINNGQFRLLGLSMSYAMLEGMENVNWQPIYDNFRKFGINLADFVNGLIQPGTFYQFGVTVAGAMNSALNLVDGSLETFDFSNWGNSLAKSINGWVDEFDFTLLGQAIHKWIQSLKDFWITLISEIEWNDIFDAIKTTLKEITLEDIAIIIGIVSIKKILALNWGTLALGGISKGLANAMASALGVELGNNPSIGNAINLGLGKAFKNASANLSAYIENTIAVGGLPSLKGMAESVFGTVGTTILGITSLVGGSVLAIHEFVDMWKNGWDIISEILKDLGIALAVVGAILLGVPTTVALVVGGVIAVVTSLVVVIHEHWDDIKNWSLKTCDNIKEGITKRWNNVKDFLTNKVKDIRTTVSNTFTGMGTDIAKRFEDIHKNTVERWNKVKDFFTNTLDAMKKKAEGINWHLPDLNIKLPHLKMDWDYNSAQAKFLQKLGLAGFPSFSVDFYANGGMPDVGSLFIAGESGAEIVANSSRGTEVLNEGQIAETISIAMQKTVVQTIVPLMNEIVKTNKEIADKDYSVQIGDRDIARANRRGQKSMGYALFT